MMASEITITLHAEWRQASPEDARRCLGCDEQIFLTEWQLWLYIGNAEVEPAESHEGRAMVLCDACHNALTES